MGSRVTRTLTYTADCVLILCGLVPQPRRGPVDDVLVGAECRPPRPLLVVRHSASPSTPDLVRGEAGSSSTNEQAHRAVVADVLVHRHHPRNPGAAVTSS